MADMAKSSLRNPGTIPTNPIRFTPAPSPETWHFKEFVVRCPMNHESMFLKLVAKLASISYNYN